MFLILLIPQVVIHHICMLRQGVAIAIFLIAWFTRRKSVRVLLMATTPLIHSSYFIVLPLLVMSTMARRIQLGVDLRTLLFVVVGLVIGGSLGWTASLLGARQAHLYSFSMGDVSGLGLIFWGMVFTVMWLEGPIFVRRFAFEMGTIIFYLVTYFTTDVAARIFESTMLLVLLAGGHLTGWRQHFFYVILVSFGIIQYALNLRTPWLGWGI
ncbi:MAG: hypothetical protein D3910_12770 [Candidatus Electrothrix sp. ATG2]|nr:hypothetical protein [Candidatus Electrothrix sp. ATG2]